MKGHIGATLFLLFCLVSSEWTVAQASFFEKMKTQRVNSADKITWINQGPGNAGMSDIVRYHPTVPETVFFNPDMGGNYQSDNNGKSWYNVRDYDLGDGFGRLQDIKYSSADDMFALAIENSHLWQSKDRGRNWQLVKNCPWYIGPKANGSDKFAWKQKVSTLAIDPTNAKTWYIGAGATAQGLDWKSNLRNGWATAKNPRGRDHNVSGKIWKTSDGGLSWTTLSTGIDPKAQFTQIIVNPNNAQQVFAASNYGLYRSNNGGTSWQNIGTGKLPNNTILDLDYYHDGHLFTLYVIDQVRYAPAGKTTSFTGGIFRSEDLGESWIDMTGNLPVDITQLSWSVQHSYYQYIARWFGLSDRGARLTYPEQPTTALQPVQFLRVDPSRRNAVYVGLNDPQGLRSSFGPGRLWVTTDHGQSWINTAREPSPAWEIHKKYWQSRNNPTHVNMTYGHEPFNQQWGKGYAMRTIRHVDVNSLGHVMMISAHNTLLSTDNGQSWQQVDEDYTPAGNLMGRGNSNLPGFSVLQDHRLEPGILYLATGEHRLWRTTLDGEDDRVAMKYLRAMDTVSALALHPDNVNTLYVTSMRQRDKDKVYKSLDGGLTFDKNWGQATAASSYMRTRAMRIDPTNPQNIFFGVSERAGVDLDKQGGFYYSSDGGRIFTQRNNGLPVNAYIHDIAWDPRDPTYQSMFIAAQAAHFGLNHKFPPKDLYSPAIEGGLYHTTDRGLSWRKIDIAPEVHGINAVKIDQLGRMYVTVGYRKWNYHHGGLWYSDDYGTSWTQTFDSTMTESLDVSPFNPNLLVVSVARLNNNTGIYLSEDRGLSWTKNNHSLALKERIDSVEFSIHDPEVLWLAERGAGFSKGRHWNQISYKYDFGPEDSSNPNDWENLAPQSDSDEVFWHSAPGATDRGEGDNASTLNRDFVHGHEPATLEHELENGRWYVTLKFFDTEKDYDNILVKAQNLKKVEAIQVKKGRVTVVNFPVDVNNKRLVLEFSDTDTDTNSTAREWLVNSMVISRVADNQPDSDDPFDDLDDDDLDDDGLDEHNEDFEDEVVNLPGV